MIADQSNAVVDGKGLDQFGLHVGFGPRHKESPVGVEVVESSKVDVGFVHDVKRASLDLALLAEQVENFDVVHLAVADVNKTWNRTLQIYQRVKLDGSLGCSKWRPSARSVRCWSVRRRKAYVLYLSSDGPDRQRLPRV